MWNGKMLHAGKVLLKIYGTIGLCHQEQPWSRLSFLGQWAFPHEKKNLLALFPLLLDGSYFMTFSLLPIDSRLGKFLIPIHQSVSPAGPMPPTIGQGHEAVADPFLGFHHCVNSSTLSPQSQVHQSLLVFLDHWSSTNMRLWCKPNPQEWNKFCPGELCLCLSEPGKMPKEQKVSFSLTIVKLHWCDKYGLFSSLFHFLQIYLDCPSPRHLPLGPAMQTQHLRFFNITQRALGGGLLYLLLFDCEHGPFAPPREQLYGYDIL